MITHLFEVASTDFLSARHNLDDLVEKLYGEGTQFEVVEVEGSTQCTPVLNVGMTEWQFTCRVHVRAVENQEQP